ncbi:MAG: hypothetical protein ACRERX_23770 [Pseudomonas sp.]
MLWRWSDTRAPSGLDFLLLPDFLPSLLQPSTGGPLTQPTLIVSGCSNDVAHIVGGVSALGSRTGDLAAPLQLIIARAGAVAETRGNHPAISLSGGFTSGLSEGERQRVYSLLTRLFRFLESHLECETSCHLCVMTPAELAGIRFQPGGICLVATPDAFGIRHAEGTPADFALAAGVAAVWWSGACRFHGRGAGELQLAIQSLMGFAWLDHIGAAIERDRVATQIAEMGRTNIPGLVIRPPGLCPSSASRSVD